MESASSVFAKQKQSDFVEGFKRNITRACHISRVLAMVLWWETRQAMADIPGQEYAPDMVFCHGASLQIPCLFYFLFLMFILHTYQ